MIDTHCHILTGFDDGPRRAADSLELCRELAAQGVTAAIATPHSYYLKDTTFTERIGDAVNCLNALLQKERVPLTVYPGAEIRLDPCIDDCLSDGNVMTLAGTHKYLLLELPSDVAIDFSPLITVLHSLDIAIIIAHAERNLFCWRDPGLLNYWRKQGLLLQVTASGLAGQWGQTVQQYAWYLICSSMADLIASDAHNLTRRPPLMKYAYDQVCTRLGNQTASRLFVENPNCILDGRRIEPWLENGVYPEGIEQNG